jgi:hypothetical protein
MCEDFLSTPFSLASQNRCEQFFRRLKSALRFFVINYGLKSVAWNFEVAPTTNHATGFSQWLMTNMMSAEFIRRLGERTSR